MSHVHVLQHPLVSHHLCQLRDKRTRPPEFRSAVSRLAMLIGVRATDDLPTQPVTIPTPVADAPCHELAADIGIVPVLRAGLGMVDPLLDLIPDA
ncbi:MAG: uracil phosphoribosyltransferase, partial [Rhodopirellula bahusiensis]